MKILPVFVIGLLITIGAVYESKHDTEQAAAKVSDLHRQIDAEKEKISLLNAEYSALIQPERMEKLVSKYPGQLEYVQLSAEQIVNVHDLPLKPIYDEQYGEWPLAEISHDLDTLESAEWNPAIANRSMP